MSKCLFSFAAAPENGTSIELKCQEDPTDWVLDYNDRRAISSLVANCTINGLVDQIIHQSCSISIFPYRFNINYSVCFLININITINYFQEGLSISILYQLFKKFPYQFQYQYLLSISPYNIVKITNFLSISHCYQYQY